MYSTFIGVTVALWVICSAVNLGWVTPVTYSCLREMWTEQEKNLVEKIFVFTLSCIIITILVVLLALILGPIFWVVYIYWLNEG